MKPTEAQAKEFWEGCGLKLFKASDNAFHWFSLASDGNYDIVSPCDNETSLPIIDLNNLQRYAFPLIQEKGYEITMRWDAIDKLWHIALFAIRQPFKDYIAEDKDFEDALFWACYPVIIGKEVA